MPQMVGGHLWHSSAFSFMTFVRGILRLFDWWHSPGPAGWIYLVKPVNERG
jgi:hypothetical protein